MTTFHSRRGFTLAELLVVLLLSAVLLHILARVADVISRVELATRSQAEARALESTVDRVLRTAIEAAGHGIPAAPNLAGIGVKTAVRPDGSPADTLIVLQGDGAAMATASRPCPAAPTACIALLGDQRRNVRPGDLLLVGTRTTGLAAVQVTGAPAVFHAPCGGDCREALVCPLHPGPAPRYRHVIGSVRHPGGERSSAPCSHAFFPDGGRCEEIVQDVSGAPQQAPRCRLVAGSSTYTSVPVAERTELLGFPPPPIRSSLSGTGAVPRVRAIRVRASRFWIDSDRAGDPVLVRQNSLDRSGNWRPGVPVAAPLKAFEVETLHAGAWVRGMGDPNLEPVAGNPNYVRAIVPAASGREAAWHFRNGHHSVSAVRVRYAYAGVTSSGAQVAPQAWLVAATPNLRDGGTGDAD